MLGNFPDSTSTFKCLERNSLQSHSAARLTVHASINTWHHPATRRLPRTLLLLVVFVQCLFGDLLSCVLLSCLCLC